MSELMTLGNQLLALGFGEEYTRGALAVLVQLKKETATLIQCKDGPTKQGQDDAIGVMAYTDTRVLAHHDLLLPAWEEFAKALSSVNASNQGFIFFTLSNVQLDRGVSEMLLPAFKTAPLGQLTLRYNDLGSDGLKLVAKAVKDTPVLQLLCLDGNIIESEHDAKTLIKAVMEHSSVDTLIMSDCGVGLDDAVMEAILPALNLDQLSLESRNSLQFAEW